MLKSLICLVRDFFCLSLYGNQITNIMKLIHTRITDRRKFTETYELCGLSKGTVTLIEGNESNFKFGDCFEYTEKNWFGGITFNETYYFIKPCKTVQVICHRDFEIIYLKYKLRKDLEVEIVKTGRFEVRSKKSVTIYQYIRLV